MSSLNKTEFAQLLQRKANEQGSIMLADSMREYAYSLERVDDEIAFNTEGYCIIGDRQTRIGKFLTRTNFFSSHETRAYLIPLMRSINGAVLIADLEAAARSIGFGNNASRQQRVKNWASVVVPAVKSARREFVFFKGEALVNYMANDVRQTGTCPNSCMTGSYDSFSRDTLHIYQNNPSRVRLIVARGHWGDTRAFIWKTDEGDIVVDRAYPSDRNHAGYIALKSLAQRKGWVFRAKTGFPEPGYNPLPDGENRHVTLDLAQPLANTRMPYLDTFYAPDDEVGPDDTTIRLRSFGHHDDPTFLEVGGHHEFYESRRRVCDSCGDYTRNNECADDPDYCTGCGTLDTYSGEYYREVITGESGTAIPETYATLDRHGNYIDQRRSVYLGQRYLYAMQSETSFCGITSRRDYTDEMFTADDGTIYSPRCCAYYGFQVPQTTLVTETTNENV